MPVPKIETHAAEADGRYFETALSQCSLVHFILLFAIPTGTGRLTSCQALAAQIEFGTGFLAPETDAPTSALEAMSLGRDRKIPAIIREKWPQKRLFCVWARRREFPKTGWWAHQGSNLGPAD